VEGDFFHHLQFRKGNLLDAREELLVAREDGKPAESPPELVVLPVAGGQEVDVLLDLCCVLCEGEPCEGRLTGSRIIASRCLGTEARDEAVGDAVKVATRLDFPGGLVRGPFLFCAGWNVDFHVMGSGEEELRWGSGRASEVGCNLLSRAADKEFGQFLR
jgi:hypothetical protein